MYEPAEQLSAFEEKSSAMQLINKTFCTSLSTAEFDYYPFVEPGFLMREMPGSAVWI
jgi:hypothetical protein